jgi:hypothetical protein
VNILSVPRSKPGHVGLAFISAVIVCSAIILTLFVFTYLPVTYLDWIESFRPAAVDWQAPYRPGVYNPPWLYAILHPFTWLDPRLGVGLLMVISVVIVGAYVGTPKKAVVVACSAPLIVMVTLGQIDALVLLGLMIPGEIGLVWLLMKPQGVFLAALRRINFRSATILILVLVSSIIIWGFWWQDLLRIRSLFHSGHNASFFPYTILFGLLPLYLGLKRKSDAMLCLASICISPYFMITSMLPTVAAIVRESDDKRIWLITVLGSWTYFFLAKVYLGV